MTSSRRVLARFLTAKEFPSSEALQEYMRKHPGADKSKHTVVDEGTAKLKKDLKDFKKIDKGQEQAKKKKDQRKVEKDKKTDDAEADKLKKELESWKNAE